MLRVRAEQPNRPSRAGFSVITASTSGSRFAVQRQNQPASVNPTGHSRFAVCHIIWRFMPQTLSLRRNV